MEYNSFYGGRRGASFVIVKTYESIKEMIDAFKQGGNYKEVNYDEYVLISTPDRNSGDNGKIYRRGYNYSEIDTDGNPTGGAIFVGQISGPVGKAPQIEITTIDKIEEIKQQYKDNPDFHYRESEAEYSVVTNSLLPGAEVDYNGKDNPASNFQDVVEWQAVSLRNKETSTDTIAWIGFRTPYLVMNFETAAVASYNQDGDYEDTTVARRIDDKTHPFYEKWHLDIPKGIKGNCIDNLRVRYETADGTIHEAGINENFKDAVKAHLFYDLTVYDNKQSGELTEIDLGPYNMVKDITFTEEGSIKIEYTYDEDKNYENLIKWIDSITLDANNGQFEINYNYGGDNTKYTNQLKWVNAIELSSNGEVTVKYTTGADDDVILDEKIQWITGVRIDTNSQYLQVQYNTGTTWFNIGNPINYILETRMTEDYHLYILYSAPSVRDAIPENKRKDLDGDGRFWEDMGVVRSGVEGLLAGKFFDTTQPEYNTLQNITSALEYLNTNYPNGFEIETGSNGTIISDYTGKMAIIGTPNSNDQKFYAYNYDKNTWQFVGEFQSSMSCIAAKDDYETNPITQTLVDNLVTNGLWFIIED